LLLIEIRQIYNRHEQNYETTLTYERPCTIHIKESNDSMLREYTPLPLNKLDDTLHVSYHISHKSHQKFKNGKSNTPKAPVNVNSPLEVEHNPPSGRQGPIIDGKKGTLDSETRATNTSSNYNVLHTQNEYVPQKQAPPQRLSPTITQSKQPQITTLLKKEWPSRRLRGQNPTQSACIREYEGDETRGRSLDYKFADKFLMDRFII
jgi:hypothetical protein